MAMNERIQQLAKQAILQCVDENGFLGKDKLIRINPDNYVDHYVGQEFIGKLTELIVKECVEVCNSRVGNSDYNTGRMHCASDIREHFGVEK
jgi:hypothetical protein